MTWKHKDTTIEFDAARAKFSATVNGKRLTAGSLDAIKKQIEAATAIAFEPFKALASSYRSDWEEVEVIGIGKEKRRYGIHVHHFDCKDGSSPCSVTPDTPANRKLITAYQKRRKEIYKLKTKLDDELQALLDAIPQVKADDYAIGKTA